MNLTKTCLIGVLLLGGALWGIRASADTEVWQDVRQEQGNTAPLVQTPSVDWEQRALKRPQAATPTAQRWVSPRVAQRPSYDQTAMETVPLPEESATPIQKQAAARLRDREVIEPGATQFEAIPPGSIFGNDPPGPQHGCASCGQAATLREVAAIAGRATSAARDGRVRFRLGGLRRLLRPVPARPLGFRRRRRLQRTARSRRHQRKLRRERRAQSGPTAGRSLGMRLPDRRQLRPNRFLRGAGRSLSTA